MKTPFTITMILLTGIVIYLEYAVRQFPVYAAPEIKQQRYRVNYNTEIYEDWGMRCVIAHPENTYAGTVTPVSVSCVKRGNW